MPKSHSPVVIPEAHSHLNTISAQKGNLLLNQGSRAAPKAHMVAETGE